MYRRNYPDDPGFAESISAARLAHRRQAERASRSIRRVLPSSAAGLCLLLAGMWLLFWNEGRAVAVDRSLSEGLDRVVSLPSADAAMERNNGELVHVSGPLSADATLLDAEFGLRVPAIRLQRVVEMYQWVEADEDSDSSSRRYTLEWRQELVDSSGFVAGAAKRNPPTMPFVSRSFEAATCRIGAFQLDAAFQLKLSADWRLEDADRRLNLQSLATRGFEWRDGALHSPPGASLQPQVGDLRIYWLTAGLAGEPYSAIGQQLSTSRIVPHGPQRLALIGRGYVPPGRLLGRQVLHNRVLTWTVRAAGWLLLFLATMLMTSPIEALLSFAPRPLRRSLATLEPLSLGVCLSGSLSLAVISAAWLRYRPLIGCAVVAFSLLPLLLPGVFAPSSANRRAQWE